jgi:hypothetical protein
MKFNLRTVFIYLALITSIISISSCSESQKPCHVVIEKEGKKHLYSHMGSYLVDAAIKKGEAPAVMKATRIIKESDGLFITPDQIPVFANLIGGNYLLFDKEEPNYHGYAALGETPLYRVTNQTVAGETIGDTKIVMNYTLIKEASDETLTISYSSSPNLEAISNTEIRSLTVRLNNGGNEFTSKDQVVVNIKTLTDFFSKKCTARYSEEEDVLYLTF